jgi:hypothetical protein
MGFGMQSWHPKVGQPAVGEGLDEEVCAKIDLTLRDAARRSPQQREEARMTTSRRHKGTQQGIAEKEMRQSGYWASWRVELEAIEAICAPD